MLSAFYLFQMGGLFAPRCTRLIENFQFAGIAVQTILQRETKNRTSSDSSDNRVAPFSSHLNIPKLLYHCFNRSF